MFSEKYQIINLISFIVTVIILFSIQFNIVAQQTDDMARAISDAKRDAELADVTTWNGVGCLFGVFGMIAAAVIDPPVPATKLLGKSPEYVVFYTETYRSNLKQNRIEAAGAGCLVGSGIVLGSLILFTNADSMFE